MHRLFVYGTLAPGRPNAHVLAGVAGEWEEGTVRGDLMERGWGATAGYPALVLRPDANEVAGFVLSSDALDGEWERLDEFEGPGYERVLAPVTLSSGAVVEAWLCAERAEAF